MKLFTKLASKNKCPGYYPSYNDFITCDALLIKKNLNIPSNTNWIWKNRLPSLNFNCMKRNWRPRRIFNQNQYRHQSFKRLWLFQSEMNICTKLTPSFIFGNSVHQGHAYHNKKSVLDIDRIRRNQSLYSRKDRRDNDAGIKKIIYWYLTS